MMTSDIALRFVYCILMEHEELDMEISIQNNNDAVFVVPVDGDAAIYFLWYLFVVFGLHLASEFPPDQRV
jgi:hypothetical protein